MKYPLKKSSLFSSLIVYSIDGAKDKISANFEPFIHEGEKVLVHGHSKVVLAALVKVAR